MNRLKSANLTLVGCGLCYTCSTVKPASDFHLDCTRPNGICARCKPCEAIRSALRSAEKRSSKRTAMVEDLHAVIAKHPGLRELIVWTGARLAA